MHVFPAGRERRYHHSVSSLLSMDRRWVREHSSQNHRIVPRSTDEVQVSGVWDTTTVEQKEQVTTVRR